MGAKQAIGALAMVLVSCSGATLPLDAGVDAVDAGSDAGPDSEFCAAQRTSVVDDWFAHEISCLDSPDAGPSQITFRLRNAGTVDLWVPLAPLYGTNCRAAITLFTCQGSPLVTSACSSVGELCPELTRLAPDASVQLLAGAIMDSQTAACGCASAGLPAGRYLARFSYSGQEGLPDRSTEDVPFTLTVDGAPIEILLR